MSMPRFTTIHTLTGREVRVRRLQPDDAPYLIAMFENLSDESRYRRFQQRFDQPDMDRLWTQAEQIASEVRSRAVGLLAFADLPGHPEAPVGAARYVRTAEDEAEVALTVIDEFQREGLGTELALRLIELAKRDGVRRLVGVVLNDNQGVWSLLRRLPYEVTRQMEGSDTLIAIHIDRSSIGEPLAIADLKRQEQ